MKICPSCKTEHNNPQSIYCCRTLNKKCNICSAKYIVKCRRYIKKNCSKKCSAQIKYNKCLNCGNLCKGKYCKKDVIINCKYCRKKNIKKCSAIIAIYCDGVCAARDPEIKEKTKKTQLANHDGVYAFNTEKQKKTMIERYGHESPSKNEDVKKKIKEVQFAKNGGVYAFNTKKQEETMLKKYGSKGRLGDPNELKKQHELMIEKYGVKTPSENPEFLERAMSTLIRNYGQIFNNSNISKVNLKFGEKIEKELGLKVEYEHHLEGSFFDIYIPEYNLAIEINPTITHNSTHAFACKRNKCSEQPCKVHKPLPTDYHFKKSKIAMKNNLKLIHMFEWDSEEKVFSLIKRNCLETKQLILFCSEIKQEKFKLSGDLKNDSKENVYYGVFSEDELMAVVLLKKDFSNLITVERNDSNLSENLILEAILNEILNDGTVSKLSIEIDFNTNNLKNNFLKKLGFVEKLSGPKALFHNEQTNEVIKEEDLSEDEENLLSNRFVKIYTAGSRLFTWNKDY